MIRKLFASTLFFTLGLMLFVAAAHASEVAQGKCLSYEKGKSVVIEEYDTNFTEEMRYGHPTGIESTFDLSAAKVGRTPEPGDVLRISYVVDGSTKKALKIMNVSKQDLMKK